MSFISVAFGETFNGTPIHNSVLTYLYSKHFALRPSTSSWRDCSIPKMFKAETTKYGWSVKIRIQFSNIVGT